MNRKNTFRIIFLTLVLLFIGLYFASNSGYIDNSYKNKKILTEEQIKIFEEDVKNNKPINIDNYVIDKEEQYDNKLSKIGLKISNTIGKCFESAINYVFGKFQSSMK